LFNLEGSDLLNIDEVCCLTFLDLEWKLTYVGSAEDETYDQQLESVLVGPVNVGTYRFVLQVKYTCHTINQVQYFHDAQFRNH
jgi:hypothetical protein